MSNSFILTIGRQFGSGGRVIGKELSKRLGFEYYDKELINAASEHSGLDKGYFEAADEKEIFSLQNILFSNWLSLGSGGGSEGGLVSERIFKYQSDVIEMLSNKGNCIIVGRCADYILRNYPHCINIFLHAPLENRIERVMSRDKITYKEASALVQKRDKQRAMYYNFYTNKEWGNCKSYHMSIDTSILGIEEATESILQFILKYRASLL